MLKTMLNLAGYKETNLLYTGNRTLVYRGIRASDRIPVIIKVLRNPEPNFQELVQFRNQYVIIHNLDSPYIVQPLALENYNNSYALIMPDSGAIALNDYWQQSERSLPEFFNIAIQLADALHYLIGKRIIHKDIKPANILVHPQTHQVQLIDFSISSLLPKEQQQLMNPNVLEGTLAYISPEQTGRMNRGIDYRTDFYSLGVTFYELLTGKLPFETDDPMELVHCHIAKVPTVETRYIASLHSSPSSPIPQVISEIVLKLMAKNAEDRYQSAMGLKHDLEQCWQQLETRGEITQFEIGKRDLGDRFLIPEKLYGRDKEVAQLLAAFERMSRKSNEDFFNSETILVAGYSGVGKTAVIEEIHRPIVEKRGYFIKGKFDQFQRNIPLSAFVQAFRDLMKQLYGENDAQLARWKANILAALGKNAQVIIDTIPELEQIIGKQPPVPALSGTAAQNRFNILFEKFVEIFTTREHPLVIFLDDLQWADSASLKLIQLLTIQSKSKYLLTIGAYRDNEVFPAHPLILTLEEMKKNGTKPEEIVLQPLAKPDLNQWVADTLSCSLDIAQPLTDLIFQKTKGNPFFATQFLQALYEDRLIEFNFEARYWQCDLARVRELALTDDVVEFITGRLHKLSLHTQNLLKFAACIGNQFDLDTLAIVSEKSPEETATYLWAALEDGLILPQNETYKFYFGENKCNFKYDQSKLFYKFLHDRVQQAAYSLIPEAQKQTTHYHIGQLLLNKISPNSIGERIFEIVSQLNYGTSLITEQNTRDELAELNLIACRKARAATAYEAGREYASIGLSLLGENCWTHQYKMSLAFHDLAVELASLCGDFEAMDRLMDVVISQARYLPDRVHVYRIKIITNVSQNKMTEAIAIAKKILQQFGVTFPKTPTEKDIQSSIAEISQLIGDRKIDDLINQPIMSDPEKISIVEIADSIFSATHIAEPLLLPLVVALSVKLSIQYGNTPISAFAYGYYGAIFCTLLKNIDIGSQFGQLAIKLLERVDEKVTKASVFCVVVFSIMHRKFHANKTLQFMREAYICAEELGQLEFVGYSASNFCWHSFWCGNNLATLEQDTAAYCNRLRQLNQSITANYLQIFWQSILNLLGKTEHPSILDGENFPESAVLSDLISSNDLLGLFMFYGKKLILCYLFDDMESAQSSAKELRKYLVAGNGTLGEPAFYFYDSLSILAALDSKSSNTSEVLDQVEANQVELQKYWADYAPMNYQHKVDLVAAEKYRAIGDKSLAIDLYDRAIAGAKENEYIQEEALANELAAKFYLSWGFDSAQPNGKEKIATTYMTDAYYCYARWGAKAKTNQLEAKYPQLLTAILQDSETDANSRKTSNQSSGTITTKTYLFDLASAIETSQAISGEISLDALLSKLMQIVVKNAGADKGGLILNNSGNWEIVTKYVNDNCDLCLIPLDQSNTLPNTIINRVKRTQETVLINQFEKEAIDFSDPCWYEQPPKSLLCTPIIHIGQLIGILYLENKLAANAFTQERVEVLNLLISQAAISIENARLYTRLEDYSHNLELKVEQRTQELEKNNQQLQQTLNQLQQTQAQLIQTEKMSSIGQMVAGIAHEINNPITFISGNIDHAREYFQELLELIDVYEQNLPNPNSAIEEKLAGIDLEFLCNDLKQVFDSMQKGSDRIRKIILGLRNFSRLDESGLKRVDLHEGLENTLLIVQHRLKAPGDKYEIQIQKNYGTLPLVNCYPNQLNQVFLHIISNAIDVLTTSEVNQSPEICITTEMKDTKTATICIADNGPGMSEAIRQKVFDPFFTTKTVGKGTGLGLSTSYQIVTEQHQGELKCISQPGQGTDFIIHIPI